MADNAQNGLYIGVDLALAPDAATEPAATEDAAFRRTMAALQNLVSPASTGRRTPQIVSGGPPGAILLPAGMNPRQALDHLNRFCRNDEAALVRLSEDVDVFPWDGAYAMKLALEEMFGAVFQKEVETAGGKRPPSQINIPTDAFGGMVSVPWGRVEFPGGDEEEWLGIEVTGMDGRLATRLEGEVRRRNKSVFDEFVKLVRAKVAQHSLYKGKAIRIAFNESPTPVPTFLDLTKTAPEDLVFRKEIMRALETNIWTPLRHREACAAAGIPFKRGILLEGPYGTGKTLVAHATARVGSEHGVTFVYLQDVNDIADAIRFAQRYAPVVIFAEDVDRTTDGERDVELDQVLNTIDGVDTKGADVMIVFTTNHVEKINPAMGRPGRLDAVLTIEPPDAEAAERLLRRYARGLVGEATDLTAVAQSLDGKIPAVIREVVERSKLEMIRRTAGRRGPILAADLAAAVTEVLEQQKVFVTETKQPPTLDTMLRQLVTEVVEAVTPTVVDPIVGNHVRAANVLRRDDRRIDKVIEYLEAILREVK